MKGEGSVSKVQNYSTIDLYTFTPFVFGRIDPLDGEKPKSRSGHRIVCNDKELILFGGYNPSRDDEPKRIRGWPVVRPLLKELWKFKFATQTWTRLRVRRMPRALISNAMTLSGNILIVYGGTGVPFESNCSNNLYVCNLSKNKLHFEKIKVSGDKPMPLYGQAILVTGNYLYTVGGTTGFQYSLDVHKLDLRTRIWKAEYVSRGHFEEPEGRYRHELGFDGKRLYVLGGGTADLSFGFEQLPTYDIVQKRWFFMRTVPDPKVKSGFPTARRFHSCTQIKGSKFVYLSGGFDGNETFNDTWKLDLKNMQWEKMTTTTLILKTYFHSSSLTPAGKLVTYGGINSTDKSFIERNSDIYSAWVIIPTLKEICWEAVKFYNLTSNLNANDLSLLGVPAQFVNRM